MDDPVLRGRIISIGIGVIGCMLMWWFFSSKASDTADAASDVHRKALEIGCEEGGQAPGTPAFSECVKRATAECGGGAGLARNLATCARMIGSQEYVGNGTLLAPGSDSD